MSQFNTVPPMYGEPDFGAEPPAWPKVIGIISIVLAALGLVCGGCGIVQNFAAVAQGGAQVQTPSGQMLQLPPPPMLANIIMVVGWLWGILLLIAGIQTLRRAFSGRMLHLVYAGVSILISIVNILVTWSYIQATIQALSADPQMAQMSGFITGAMYGSVCVGLVFGMGYPVFLLIWFGLIKKRPEDMGPPPQELVA